MLNGTEFVLDAVDDVATRFLTNDSCLQHKTPWIYAGVAGTQGMIMLVPAHGGPCLRCLYPHPPEKEESANCANSEILPQTVTIAVSIQISLAIKILTGKAEAGTLIKFDCMEPKIQKIKVPVKAGCICNTTSKHERPTSNVKR